MIDKSIKKNQLRYFNSIAELTDALGVSKPLHPLITFFNHSEISPASDVRNLVANFYMVSYKTNLKGKMKYGQGYYDFDDGGLIFVSPNQALSVVDDSDECEGFSLFFHPDFLLSYPLSKSISKYGFFAYNINESLHLSDREREKITSVFEDIHQELNASIDEISQDLIISYIEVLLNYSNRYYKRQFITRKVVNTTHVEKFENLLADYFNSKESILKGLPTVKYFSDKLNLSASYLSDMLRSATGLNTQQHIHSKLIDIAKEKLTSTNLTAAEIGYELGFEHPQSFNKLFKLKTGISPVEFRQGLN
ncbi:helix-turn-helix domain-containing protein [Flavobacterium defluvii]|uniref:AraC-like ligand binding domain-containing protein n=1 Tax=Flavobacterium defluvii TaxID=370979 RepID=A0A1M5NAE8_9FLAO|nr:helix-turn-helix domain-containing protein [Flavobacterium defluvii]SHG86432.1 AraC-like ligand binding domain-containing protein [Flavobacterium defluvii]